MRFAPPTLSPETYMLFIYLTALAGVSVAIVATLAETIPMLARPPIWSKRHPAHGA
jgi:hypothetical protein